MGVVISKINEVRKKAKARFLLCATPHLIQFFEATPVPRLFVFLLDLRYTSSRWTEIRFGALIPALPVHP